MSCLKHARAGGGRVVEATGSSLVLSILAGLLNRADREKK